MIAACNTIFDTSVVLQKFSIRKTNLCSKTYDTEFSTDFCLLVNMFNL